MARRDRSAEDDVVLPPPASTLEGREDQLIALSYDLIEKRMMAGTASAQEAVHFANRGSRKSQLELEKILAENEVLRSRVKEMESRKSQEDLLARALAAFKGYSGQEDPFDGEDGDYQNIY